MTRKALEVTFTYTNWRGQVLARRVVPTGKVLFESNEWHPEPQWLLEGKDLETGHTRLFAMKDISGWKPVHTPDQPVKA